MSLAAIQKRRLSVLQVLRLRCLTRFGSGIEILSGLIETHVECALANDDQGQVMAARNPAVSLGSASSSPSAMAPTHANLILQHNPEAVKVLGQCHAAGINPRWGIVPWDVRAHPQSRSRSESRFVLFELAQEPVKSC